MVWSAMKFPYFRCQIEKSLVKEDIIYIALYLKDMKSHNHNVLTRVKGRWKRIKATQSQSIVL